MTAATIPLGELMATRKQSLDPRKTPERQFALYSIPAYDEGQPAETLGGEIGSSKQVLQSGDVLLSRIVPHIRRAWIVDADGTLPAVGSSEWIVFRGDGFHPPYLRHVLLSDPFHREFMNTVAGVGGSLLRARPKYVAQIKVPLPPIDEQRRIAAVLDASDELRAKRREALSKFDTLAQAIFVDMFGDPATNSYGWSTRPLREVSVKFSDGPFGSNLKSDHYQESGVRVVRLQNIHEGKFVDDVAAFISEEHFARLSRHECRPGDVLVATMGDPNLRACIQPDWLEVALNKADCVQIRVDASVATGEWLCTLLNHPSTEEMAQGLVRGQTRSRISMGRLRELRIPVPPVELQAEFSERNKEVVREAERLRRGRDMFDVLFGSLQQRAFRGEL